jgi:(1->4)-alpha-D-glucan 1-alpha-D-glucosylmutase
MRPVRATYRLQFEPAFRFSDALQLLPTFAQLGISHLYCSPVFESVPGSRHGYDVIDPQRVREELGGEAEWRSLAAAAAEHEIGLIADIVPNHLAISHNAWWSDVLEHGRDSPYSSFFDLSLDRDSPEWTLVIPLLAEPYGAELESGHLTLLRDEEKVWLAYGTERFPISAASLESSIAACGGDVDALIARLNRDRESLHELLEAQHYRLAWWRLARDESPYRRFFDINALVAMRTECPSVFEAMHRLPLSWVRDGVVDGLRVDHIDGLADPSMYARTLRERAPEAYLAVEKILAADEPWPGWPVDGTTGYEFGALVTRLLTAPESEGALTTFYEQFTGQTHAFDEIARDARRDMLEHWLVGDAERVAAVLYQRCQNEIHLRDYSERDCLTLIQELIVWTPVYRTYVGADGPTPHDVAVLRQAFEAVRMRRPDFPEPLIDFAGALCLAPDTDRTFVARFQQLCTAVAAKAVEDTAFYRYSRFIAHNDVGADPGLFSTVVQQFHSAILGLQAAQASGMRATSTHDSKRSEDIRARLTVLSEIPERWTARVEGWSAQLDALRTEGQPDREFEYYLYQSLVGAWPLSRERAHAHAEKAVREAKLFTNWTTPAPEYERAVHRFIDGMYDDRDFTDSMDAFVQSLSPADEHKSLAQTLLKITVPGTADFYQGSHEWLRRLADPDNREPIDYAHFSEQLQDVTSLSYSEAASRGTDGLAKLWLTARALRFRRQQDALSPPARYEALQANGPGAEAVLAFLRGDAVVVVVPVRTFERDWKDTSVELPGGRWTSVLTGDQLEGGRQSVVELWRSCPVALLDRTD